MKSKDPSLFAALLLGLLLNALLADRSGYWTRAGAVLAPVSIAALLGVGWMFACGWRRAENRLTRALFAGLLAASSVLELLRLWRLAAAVYPHGTTLLGFCCTVLLPVIYLRRVSAISQTANVLLCLLLAVCAVTAAAVAPYLRVFHLQMPPLDTKTLGGAFWAQWVLYPELLLPALWPDNARRGPQTLLRLTVFSTLFGLGVNLVLELFFGAALPGRQSPLHTAAQSGALSVFNRLEWLQLLLWTMLVSLKLALYLYAMVRLCGGRSEGRDTAVGLDRFPFYLAGMVLLCVLLRGTDLTQAFALRNGAAWCLAGFVGITGGLQWLLGAREGV